MAVIDRAEVLVASIALRRHHAFERGEALALGAQPLDDRLDDEPAGRERAQVAAHDVPDALPRRLGRRPGQAVLLGLPRQRLVDPGARARNRPVIEVLQDDRVSRDGGDLRDPAAHGTGPEDTHARGLWV